jgi:hypothetical protein
VSGFDNLPSAAPLHLPPQLLAELQEDAAARAEFDATIRPAIDVGRMLERAEDPIAFAEEIERVALHFGQQAARLRDQGKHVQEDLARRLAEKYQQSAANVRAARAAAGIESPSKEP